MVWNLTNVLGGAALLRVANFLAVVIIARTQGPEVLGPFAVTLAYATIAMTLLDSGLQTAIVRDIAADPACASRNYSRLAVAKACTTLTALLLMMLFAYLFQVSVILSSIGILVGIRTALHAYCEFQIGAFKAINRMGSVGAVQIAHCVFLLCGLGLVVVRRGGMVAILTILVLGQLFELVSELTLLRRFDIRFTAVSVRASLASIKDSSTMGLTSVMAAVVLRLDVITLTWMADAVVVGEFAAAQSVITIVYVMAWLVGTVIMPDLVKTAESWSGIQAYVRRWGQVAMGVAALAGVGAISAFWLTPFIFGTDFQHSGQILAVLLLASPLILYNSVCLAAAITLDQRRFYLVLCMAVAALSITGNLVLGRIWAGTGVAVSVVLREAFAGCLNSFHFHRERRTVS